MTYLNAMFFIATITDDRKVIIHRMTASPAKAIQYRSQKMQDGLENVLILRKSSDGNYLDVTEGVRGDD